MEKFKPIYATYSVLTDTRERIFLENSAHLLWKNPEPLKNQRAKRDPSKFCRFHNDIGHNTDDYRHLKDEIETLIRARPLAHYAQNRITPKQLAGQNIQSAPETPANHNGAQVNQDIPPSITGGEITTIFEGPHLAGTSKNAQKRYVHEMRSHNGVEFVSEQRLSKQQ